MNQVFGADSTQAGESSSAQFNDFIGAAIHCAQNSPFCAPQNTPVADALPDEPGGYNGYQALFGLKYIAPALGGLRTTTATQLPGFTASTSTRRPRKLWLLSRPC